MDITYRNLNLRIFAIFAAMLATLSDATAKPISVEFSVYAPEIIENIAFQPAPDARLQLLTFFGRARSKKNTYHGEPSIVFKVFPANAQLQAGANTSVLAVAEIPEGIHRALLLFVPVVRPGTLTTYNVIVVNDDVDTLPLGHIAVLNVSGQTFSGEIGRKKVSIDHGSNPPFEATRQTRVRLTGQFNGENFNAATQDVKLAENERALMVLFPPSSAGQLRPQLRILYDKIGEITPKPVSK